MPRLENYVVPVPIKLGIAWAATVLCYIYCDYFDLYVPEKLQDMQNGQGPFGPVSQWSLLGAGVLLLIPCLMPFLSVFLSARASRIVNIAFGVLYTLIMLLLVFEADWYFYKLFAVVEAGMTAAIAWTAWRWPRIAVVPPNSALQRSRDA